MSISEQVEGRNYSRRKLQGVISDSIIKTQIPWMEICRLFLLNTYSSMTTWNTNLRVPAHRGLPVQEQPPSLRRLLVQFPPWPEGGDVIRRQRMWVLGPGRGRHKTNVSNQTRCLFISDTVSDAGVWMSALTFASSELSLSLIAVIRLQLRQAGKQTIFFHPHKQVVDICYGFLKWKYQHSQSSY